MPAFRLVKAVAAAAIAATVAAEAAAEPAVYLDQGWDVRGRQLFYNEPQGSPIIPLAWFLALEQPGEVDRLFQDNAYLSRFGLIPEAPHGSNLHGLPVGLTSDRGLIGDEAMLGMNCAACHVGILESNGVAVQIDGAPANFDFIAFMFALDRALTETLLDDARLDRFASRLNASKERLARRLEYVIGERADWNTANLPPIEPGPGRVDALGVILNQVVANFAERPDNARVPNAPVSWPFLWGAPYLTFAQYNAVVPNNATGAMTRNIGQVLGVFGEVSLLTSTLPPGYPSTVRLAQLGALEEELRTLTPPKWADLAALGAVDPVDLVAAKRGAEIYQKTCVRCHGLMNGDDPGEIGATEIAIVDIDKIGTDPTASENFVRFTADAGPYAGKPLLFATGAPICEEAFASDLLVHATLGVLANEAASHVGQVGASIVDTIGESVSTWLGFHRHADAAAQTVSAEEASEYTGEDSQAVIDGIASGAVAPRLVTNGCGTSDRPAQIRARPLNAIWATGPFLHNGSVPTLADMLKPAAERPATFYTGAREFDQVDLGFESGPAPGRFLFDTALPGNANTGHEIGVGLGEEEKRDLLEYLKTL